ncbi:unnamed protein product [Boreogadus saida]
MPREELCLKPNQLNPQSSSEETHQARGMGKGEKTVNFLPLQLRLLEGHWEDKEEIWCEVQQEGQQDQQNPPKVPDSTFDPDM